MKRPGSLKRLAANLLLVLISLCVATLGAEFVLRHVDRDEAPVSPRLFLEYDALLGWRKIPLKEGWHVKREYRVHEKINSRGLRGSECPYQKPEGEFRILVLGDSFCEGYSVAQSDLFIQPLQDALNRREDGIRYRVINGGTGGYSTDQELLFFRSEGRKYQPDLVLLMFYENDVWFNNQTAYFNRYKPLFRLDGDELILTNVPVPKYDFVAKKAPAPAGKGKLTVKQWLNQRSRIYAFVREKLKRISWLNAAAIRLGLAQRPTESRGDGGRVDQPGSMPPPDQFLVWRTPPPAQIQWAWRMTEQLLAALKSEVETSGAELLVFCIPNRASVYEDALRATREKYGLSDEGWDLDKVAIDLQSACERQAISFINPIADYRREAERLRRMNERLYYVHDSHWNANGHELASDILLEYIETDYLRETAMSQRR